MERWGVGGKEWRELIEDETMVVVMKPSAFGGRWDGGGEDLRELVEDKENMEVMKPSALEESWDGGAAQWTELVEDKENMKVTALVEMFFGEMGRLRGGVERAV